MAGLLNYIAIITLKRHCYWLDTRSVMQEWITDIRDQCQRVKVPFFFKQWGSVQKTRSGQGARSKVASNEDEMPAHVGMVKA